MSRTQVRTVQDGGCPRRRFVQATPLPGSSRVRLGIGLGGRGAGCFVCRARPQLERGMRVRGTSGSVAMLGPRSGVGAVRWNGPAAPCAGSQTG